MDILLNIFMTERKRQNLSDCDKTKIINNKIYGTWICQINRVLLMSFLSTSFLGGHLRRKENQEGWR